MNSVVITGANSFIGRAVCREMVSRGVTVYAVVRRYSDQIPERCNQILCDMEDYSDLDHRLPSGCDVGILLAWAGTRGASRNDAKLQKLNYLHSLQCVDSLLRTGCKTIVLSGSQAEYGPQLSDVKTVETFPLVPNTAYGYEKKHLYEDASKICAAYKVNLLEVRYFSIFGVGDYAGTMVMSSLDKMLKNEPCKFTESIQMWDFLYVTDAAAMVADLVALQAPSGAYNIGSGISYPLKRFILQMKQITDSQSELHFGEIAYPDGMVLNVQPDMTKTFSVIGERKLISFEEGILNILQEL